MFVDSWLFYFLDILNLMNVVFLFLMVVYISFFLYNFISVEIGVCFIVFLIFIIKDLLFVFIVWVGVNVFIKWVKLLLFMVM